MILWPAGMAVALVWQVFRDPAVDYRVVMAGALLPDLVDAPFGGARLMHTLAASAVLLAAVMLATRGRRRARRRWLALPIGTFVHLLVDGVWTQAETFWWPVLGADLDAPLPAFDHGPVVLAAEEILGAVALTWFWRRFRLGDRAARARFLRSGRLSPDPVP